MKIERHQSEPYLSFVEKATQAVSDGLMDCLEWSKTVLGEEMYGEENSRRNYQFFKKFLEKLDYEEVKALNDDKRIQVLEQRKDELVRERKKLQTENSRLQETYRFQARNDLFNEKIVEAISGLEPIVDKFATIRTEWKNVAPVGTGLLLISDIHAGSNFEIKGMYGEIVSRYDEQVLHSRMNELGRKVVQDYRDNPTYDKLIVGCLGDVVENVLRMSSLTKLKEPVVDTVIKFSEFYAHWLANLHEELTVPIEVVTVGGNHDVNRILGQKPEFDEENVTKLVTEFLKLRLNNLPGITVRDYTDFDVMNIQGVSVMFAHGTDSDLVTTIDYFSNLYNVDIDVVYGGHTHSPASKTIGITDMGDRECIRVGSLCGTDTFAKKIRKSARPSAYFALFEEDVGKTWERRYIL